MNPGLYLETIRNYLSLVLLDVPLESQTVTLAIHGMTNTVGLDGFTGVFFIPAYASRITLKTRSIFLQSNSQNNSLSKIWRTCDYVSEECSLECWWRS